MSFSLGYDERIANHRALLRRRHFPEGDPARLLADVDRPNFGQRPEIVDIHLPWRGADALAAHESEARIRAHGDAVGDCGRVLDLCDALSGTDIEDLERRRRLERGQQQASVGRHSEVVWAAPRLELSR